MMVRLTAMIPTAVVILFVLLVVQRESPALMIQTVAVVTVEVSLKVKSADNVQLHSDFEIF